MTAFGKTFAIFVLLAAHQALFGAADTCPDIFPCSCSVNANGQASIRCTDVGPNDIKSAFASATTLGSVLGSFSLSGSSNYEVNLPANLLNNRTFVFGGFSCSNKAQPKIDPNAFTWGPDTQGFTFGSGCDFSLQTDFLFLNGYTGWRVVVSSALNIQGFRKLGTMHNVREFIMEWNTGLGSIAHCFPDLSPSKIQWFTLNGNDPPGLNDAQMDAILGKLAGAFSTSQYIEGIWLWNNALTRVPNNLRKLGPRMVELELNGGNNKMPILVNNSMQLWASQMLNLRLDGLGIVYMEADSIMANNLAAAEVRLNDNKLTRFEKSVFRNMLSQMYANPWRGRIFLANNPFDCSTANCGVCHLKWLVVDNRNFLQFLDNARCSSDVHLNGDNAGKFFSELPASVFDGCTESCPPPTLPNLNKPPAQHVVCQGDASAGNRFPDPNSVYSYYECEDESGYYINKCPSGKIYQPQKKFCATDVCLLP